MLTKRYQTDWAMPMPRLMGPVSEPAGRRFRQLVRSRMSCALGFACGAFVDLFAEGERVHVELDGEIVDGLLEGEAALRDGRARGRLRLGRR